MCEQAIHLYMENKIIKRGYFFSLTRFISFMYMYNSMWAYVYHKIGQVVKLFAQQSEGCGFDPYLCSIGALQVKVTRLSNATFKVNLPSHRRC